MIISITGHRPNKLDNDYNFTSPLMKTLKRVIIKEVKQYNPERLICGMALGIDTMFALIAMELDIPLTAAIPFAGQETKWPKSSQNLYNKILSWEKTYKVYVSQPGYASWKMQVRNIWMVDHSGLLFAVWDKSEGGTANCVKYAQDKQANIIYINPDDYRLQKVA